jgi:hypothetical protein
LLWVNARQDAPQVSDFLKGVDAEGLFGWLDNFCRRQLFDLFNKAVVELAIELNTRAHRP